ncbi:hypothetical protein KAU33_01355, partial [Candidatus Dependentiae bacterium]|nr:hypothetical protein [Candidatus Dependentiae bacterium]
PLIISGEESEIIGGVSSPISIYEIEDAKVDLKSYSPKNLLPKLNLELIKQINDYYQKIFNDDDIKWSGLEKLETNIKDKPVYIKSDVNIGEAEEINELSEGKILYIKGSLRLTKGTKLNNIDLIISENLYILNGSTLENINIICFGEVLINGENHFSNCYIQSTEKLIISGKSEFNNTVIYQTNIRESGIINGKIEIGGETKINGFIISSLPGKFDKDDKVQTKARISKEVYINGGIINYGTTNFQGTLDGILYSGDFSDGKNKNYLKNAKIDRNKMDKNLYLPLYFKNLKPKVLEWKVY